LEKIRERFRPKKRESVWGDGSAPRTAVFPAEEYRLRLLKMPKSVSSRRTLTGLSVAGCVLLAGLCVAGEAALIGVFFVAFGAISLDYYRFLGRIRVDSEKV